MGRFPLDSVDSRRGPTTSQAAGQKLRMGGVAAFSRAAEGR